MAFTPNADSNTGEQQQLISAFSTDGENSFSIQQA
jgi:hypothetical protein